MTTSIEDSGTSEDLAVPGLQDKPDVPIRDLHPAVTEGTSDRPLSEATARDWLGSNADPDVLLSVPHLGVDEITFELRDLRAHVNLEAQVLDLVKLNVGADVSLGEVNLRIAGVRAQAMLKVRLDNVVTIVDGVVQLLDHHPEIVTSLTSGLGDALREVGTGVGSGVQEIGSGAGDALRNVGTGLGNALDPGRDVERRRRVSYHEAPPQLESERDDLSRRQQVGERRVVPEPLATQQPLAVEEVVERTVEAGRDGVQTPAEAVVVDTPVDAVVETPVEAVVVETPAETPAETPVEAPVETLVVETPEAHAQTLVVEPPTQTPAPGHDLADG